MKRWLCQIPLLLVSLVTVWCAMPVHAQQFALEADRQPVASLDGPWRFHPGDDAAWSEPGFDDSQWTTIRSEQPWDAQGYRRHSGFAWYRFTVQVPDGSQAWSIYMGPMETSYQLYIDGHIAGSFGRIQQFGTYSAVPLAFPIPRGNSGPRTVHFAVRAWHSPVWSDYVPGGFYSSSYLGATPLIEQRATADRRLQWSGAVNEYAYGVLGLLVGLVVLVLFVMRRGEREYLWFALLLLANAVDVALSIGRLLSLVSLPMFDFVDGTVQAVALFAAMSFFAIVLRAPRNRIWWLAAAPLVFNGLSTALYVFGWTSVGVASLVAALSVFPATVWILATLVRRALQRDRDALILLVPTLLWQGFPFADNILLITWQLDWQRWAAQTNLQLLAYPFRLVAAPAVGTVFIFALLLFLIRRFSLARQEETRLASELASAHSIQRTLVPPVASAHAGYQWNGISIPSEKVGGDLVDVVLLPNGSVLAYVADVSGHGLQAGILMGMVKTAVRAILLESSEDPAALLAGLCDRLNRALPAVKEAHMYATLSAVYLAPDGRVQYTLAGHPSILHYSAANHATQELACNQFPVGLLPVEAYISNSLQMEPGDIIAVATDGILEAANAAEEEFGSDRIAVVLEKSSGEDLTSIRDAIVTAAQAFGEQADDQTILLIRREN